MPYTYTHQSDNAAFGNLHPSTTWVYRERTTAAETGKKLNATAGDMLHDYAIRSDHDDVIVITHMSIRGYDDADTVKVDIWSGDPSGSGVYIDTITCDGDTGVVRNGLHLPLIQGDEPFIVVAGTTIKVDVFIMGRVMKGRKTPS